MVLPSDKVCTLWSNYALDYEDWRADLEAECPELSESDRIALMYEINDEYLNDERVNLDIELSRDIIVIADIGLWCGRRTGYRDLKSKNIKDCFYFDRDSDYATWFVDSMGDLRCDMVHHDGTNHLLYRVWRDSATEDDIEDLKEKLYRGTATRADIVRVTKRLGDYISEVYGFKLNAAQALASV